MRRSALLLVIIFSCCMQVSAQQIIFKEKSGNEKKAPINEIDSLTFEKILNGPEIGAPDTVFFPDVTCDGEYIDTTIKIYNSGDRELQITHIKIQPLTDFTFVAEPLHVMGLDPGEEYELSIRFKPVGSPGTKKADIVITSNANSGVYYKISLIGKKGSTGFTVSADSIDKGYVCPNSTVMIDLTLKNTGTANAVIKASASKQINLTQKEFEIEPGKAFDFQAAIVTSDQEGAYTGEVTFTDECGAEKTVKVEWFVSKPELEAGNLEFNAELFGSDSRVLTLKNISAGEVRINKYQTGDEQISLENIEFPLLIPPGDSVFIPVKFSPTEAKSINSEIIFSCGCGYDLIVNVKGTTVVNLVKDDFEWYVPGLFPSSGGWKLFRYGVNLDSLQVVVDSVSHSPGKCLKGYGNWGTDHSTSYHVEIELQKVPDEIYAECWAMIGQVGFSGIGLRSSSGVFTSDFATVIFGNHAHFFYTIGSGGAATTGRWENDMYMPMRWYKIKVRFNFPRKELAIWIDDEYKATDTSNSIGDINGLYFYLYTGGGYGDYGTAFFDDVRIWYVAGEE